MGEIIRIMIAMECVLICCEREMSSLRGKTGLNFASNCSMPCLDEAYISDLVQRNKSNS